MLICVGYGGKFSPIPAPSSKTIESQQGYQTDSTSSYHAQPVRLQSSEGFHFLHYTGECAWEKMCAEFSVEMHVLHSP